MKICSHAVTDTVRTRRINEDRYFVQNKPPFFAVADGTGGHAAGGVAAEIAIAELQRQARAGLAVSPFVPSLFFRQAFGQADASIHNSMQKHPEQEGMGTTLLALHIRYMPDEGGTCALVGHVGDSRCYLIRGGVGKRITSDHHTWNGALSNCLGANNGAFQGVEILGEKVLPGDTFVLATDGLNYGCKTAEEVVQLRGSLSAKGFAEALVQSALDGGGGDNVTVIVVEFTE